MPVMVETVLLVDAERVPGTPEVEVRCDGCDAVIRADQAVVARVRNRVGPPRPREAELCPDCLRRCEPTA